MGKTRAGTQDPGRISQTSTSNINVFKEISGLDTGRSDWRPRSCDLSMINSMGNKRGLGHIGLGGSPSSSYSFNIFITIQGTEAVNKTLGYKLDWPETLRTGLAEKQPFRKRRGDKGDAEPGPEFSVRGNRDGDASLIV